MNNRMLMTWTMAVGLVLGAAGLVAAVPVECKVEKVEAGKVTLECGGDAMKQIAAGAMVSVDVKAREMADTAKPAPAPKKKKAIEGC